MKKKRLAVKKMKKGKGKKIKHGSKVKIRVVARKEESSNQSAGENFVVKNLKNNNKKNQSTAPKIKVIGIGGAGGNAITRMFEQFPRGVDLIAINTDSQDLEYCHAKKRICIGHNITKGHGAGMNPDLGRQSAEEDREKIAEALSGADLIFLTAGFGGGTGSGALPVVAEIAQEMGILSVAVVTKPFSFEGQQRMQVALEAIEKTKNKVDTLIVVSNDKIFSLISKDTSLGKAFEMIDEVLKNAVLGVTEMIVSPGIINVDFADIKSIIQGAGSAIIGVGVSSGKERASHAANSAIHSALLEASVDGARGVLFSVSGHKDIKMNEINEVAKMVSENIDPSAKIIFGTYHDRKLAKGQIKVTLIATGFGTSFGRSSSTLFSDFDSSPKNNNGSSSINNDVKKSSSTTLSAVHENGGAGDEVEEESNIWDVPAFLRKKNKKK